ncbi:catecholate siderophore receptor Fiu [Herbaspirillum sp. LeCh32-8]|uniref:catecholate siderophore receptor Fiu n=1 Tax=Herbaspirillum sp. LeCh32-8 TaxID=2821356 RepID=UPI001AE788DE|nr:catecholate siderophore receptor Fiu [Herbaspirillum sp. LeCh32-8]MBP0599673.1 catecholate siderophore receptor Fiu [Herbaspirillum sp. LeCh32-8]
MTYIRNTKHRRAVRIHSSIAASAIALSLQPLAVAQEADQPLPRIEVRSERGESFKADAVSSPKFVRPLLDTPQTVTVIRPELLRQTGATSLTEALRNTPGVGTFNVGENGNSQSGDAVYMRGVSSASSIFVDNIRDTGAVTRDMFNVEQVEVFKGPAAADNGRGAAAGYINLESKSASMTDAFGSSVGYGSGNQKRVTADLNRAIDTGTGSAFRLNLMKQQSGVPGRHNAQENRWGISPTIAYGLGTPTRVQLYYTHIEQDNVPDGGIPTVGLAGFYSSSAAARTAPEVGRANFYGLVSDYNRVRSDMATLRVDHDFGSSLSLRNTTRYGQTTQHQILAAPYFADGAPGSLNTTSPNRGNWTVERIRQAKDIENEIWTNQTNLRASFGTGLVKHTVIGGLELTREQQRNQLYNGTGRNQLPPANLYAPNPGQSPLTTLGRNGGYSLGSTDTISPYLADSIDVGSQWQFSAALRVDRYRTDFRSVTATGAASTASKSGVLTNWKLAALYKPVPIGSIYLAYATSQQPPGGATFSLNAASASSADNPRFDPQQTKTWELGSKWEVFDRKLALNAALFRTDISNEIKQDATDSTLFVQSGSKRAQGVELGASGNITPAWAVSGGLALVNTSVTSGSAAQQGAQLNWSPRLSFTGWTSYQLSPSLLVGGGARYVDSMVRSLNNAAGATTNMSGVPSYWVFDAMLAYTLTPRASLQLNLYNLADRKYVAALNNSGARYIPGTPRSAVLALNLKY